MEVVSSLGNHRDRLRHKHTQHTHTLTYVSICVFKDFYTDTLYILVLYTIYYLLIYLYIYTLYIYINSIVLYFLLTVAHKQTTQWD